jgi:hypothetical protein
MHAQVDRHQLRAFENCGIEPLERQIETAHREALLLEQRSRLGEGERLPPELVGIDQYDREVIDYFACGRCA